MLCHSDLPKLEQRITCTLSEKREHSSSSLRQSKDRSYIESLYLVGYISYWLKHRPVWTSPGLHQGRKYKNHWMWWRDNTASSAQAGLFVQTLISKAAKGQCYKTCSPACQYKWTDSALYNAVTTAPHQSLFTTTAICSKVCVWVCVCVCVSACACVSRVHWGWIIPLNDYHSLSPERTAEAQMTAALCLSLLL